MILSYIVYGYIFLSCYYWITFKDNKDFKNLIIKSIASSYILKLSYDILFQKLGITFSSNEKQTIFYIVISAAFGLIIGKIISNRRFSEILCKLHINRTMNENIWDDVIRPNTWIRVFMKDGTSYLGQYKYGESFKNEPIIVLYTYQKLDSNAEVIIDNSHNLNELIMINTKDFDRIEITYQENNQE